MKSAGHSTYVDTYALKWQVPKVYHEQPSHLPIKNHTNQSRDARLNLPTRLLICMTS